MDWAQTEQRASPFHEPPKPIRKPMDADRLNLNGLHGKVYREEEVLLAPDELHADEFKAVFAAFRQWIDGTLQEEEQNRNSLTLNLNLNPAGYHPHYVGPAAEGRTDGGTYWRVYFVAQQGGWRIWKLEFESPSREFE